MFERFTDHARRAVWLAQEEAHLLSHDYIGSEHMLLGLIHEGDRVAAKTLENFGISLSSARAQVEDLIGHGNGTTAKYLPFTPRAKRTLVLSLREAEGLGHNFIGTEHLLLGLIREGEGVGVQVLTNLGVDLRQVRAQVTLLNSIGSTDLAESAVSEPSNKRIEEAARMAALPILALPASQQPEALLHTYHRVQRAMEENEATGDRDDGV